MCTFFSFTPLQALQENVVWNISLCAYLDCSEITIKWEGTQAINIFLLKHKTVSNPLSTKTPCTWWYTWTECNLWIPANMCVKKFIWNLTDHILTCPIRKSPGVTNNINYGYHQFKYDQLLINKGPGTPFNSSANPWLKYQARWDTLIPLVCSVSATSLTCLEKLKGRLPGNILIRCPNHPNWLFNMNEQQLYSGLPPDV